MEARPCCWPTPEDPALEHLRNKKQNGSSLDGRAVKQKSEGLFTQKNPKNPYTLFGSEQPFDFSV